jgi:hypothetical protein
MKSGTTDNTDFTDKSEPAPSFTIPHNIRVIREIRDLLGETITFIDKYYQLSQLSLFPPVQ